MLHFAKSLNDALHTLTQKRVSSILSQAQRSPIDSGDRSQCTAKTPTTFPSLYRSLQELKLAQILFADRFHPEELGRPR